MKAAAVLPVVLAAGLSGGCAVVSVADAGVSVVANVVRVGANVAGGVSDVARAGVRVITNSANQNR